MTYRPKRYEYSNKDEDKAPDCLISVIWCYNNGLLRVGWLVGWLGFMAYKPL